MLHVAEGKQKRFVCLQIVSHNVKVTDANLLHFLQILQIHTNHRQTNTIFISFIFKMETGVIWFNLVTCI